MQDKICMCCDIPKKLEEFHKHKGRSLGVTDCCKSCRNTSIVEKRYSLPEGSLLGMKEKQDYKCAICKEVFELLAVDHCHETNKVRGLLCTNCNNGLGRFKDNIQFLNNAIKYLRENGN